MTGKTRSTNRFVFINCPFDKQYEEMFLALILGLALLGLKPKSVLELPSSKDRMTRLTKSIKRCRFSIHDLSRFEPSGPELKYPRFNMPFELGLAVGLKQDPKFKHDCFVIDRDPHRLQIALSDYQAFDPYIYKNHPGVLYQRLCDMFGVRNLDRNESAEFKKAFLELKKFAAIYIDRRIGYYTATSFAKLVNMANEIANRYKQ